MTAKKTKEISSLNWPNSNEDLLLHVQSPHGTIDIPLFELTGNDPEESDLRISFDNKIFGIHLVDSSHEKASPIKIKTKEGIKHWREF